MKIISVVRMIAFVRVRFVLVFACVNVCFKFSNLVVISFITIGTECNKNVDNINKNNRYIYYELHFVGVT